MLFAQWARASARVKSHLHQTPASYRQATKRTKRTIAVGVSNIHVIVATARPRLAEQVCMYVREGQAVEGYLLESASEALHHLRARICGQAGRSEDDIRGTYSQWQRAVRNSFGRWHGALKVVCHQACEQLDDTSGVCGLDKVSLICSCGAAPAQIGGTSRDRPAGSKVDVPLQSTILDHLQQPLAGLGHDCLRVCCHRSRGGGADVL